MSRLNFATLLAGMGFVAMSVGLAGYAWIVSRFDALGGVQILKDGPGSLADVLNVSYGLPLTLVGAIIGFFITSLGVLITTRQGDVELLKFTQESLSSSITDYSEIVRCISRLAAVGNISLEITEKILAQISLSGGSLEDLSNEIVRTLSKPENAKLRALWQDIDASLQLAMRDVEACLRRIASDPYATAFQTLQLDKIDVDRRPLKFIEGLGIRNPYVNDSMLSENMHALADNLIEFASNTSLIHYVGSYLNTPNVVSTEDHLGYALLGVYCELSTPKRSRKGLIYGYTINFGKAWLLTLIALIPDRPVIEAFFKKLLRERGVIVLRFLELAGPSRDLFGSPYTFRNALKSLKQPESLVIVRLEDGRNEFYDRNEHGDIPTRGYVWEQAQRG